MSEPRKVRVGEIDLDVIGAAYVLDITRKDEIKLLRGEASSEALSNPSIICIEAGGSGQVDLLNFDHHGADAPQTCAAQQVFNWLREDKKRLSRIKRRELTASLGFRYLKLSSRKKASAFKKFLKKNNFYTPKWSFMGMLASYIQTLEVEGPKKLREEAKRLGIPFEEMSPALSEIIRGMMLLEESPRAQLHKGVEVLNLLEDAPWDAMFHPLYTFAVDNGFPKHLAGEGAKRKPREGPKVALFGPISIDELKHFADAASIHNKKLAEAARSANWDTTSSGLKLASLKTSLYGAVGRLYRRGAQVVVVLNPDFYGVRKATIAGDDIRVDTVLPELNAREPGWGGPRSGTIIGSPREKGTSLSLEEIVELVKKTL